MNNHRNNRIRIFRPADILLPAAFLAVALFGRRVLAGDMFVALYTVKLVALSSSNGLRIAFARQPSLRHAQGSAILALLLQFAGAAAAWFLLPRLHPRTPLLPLVASGLLLNIEHVFYEYLYAVGDGDSAALCRTITALLTLTGMMLCAPPDGSLGDPLAWNMFWLPLTAGIVALVGLVISLTMGEWPRPRFSAALLCALPRSLIQTSLYPALAAAALYLLKAPFCVPLLAGLVVYEPGKSTFRRSPLEAVPFNFSLTAIVLAAVIYSFRLPAESEVLLCCGTVSLAALCALALFGNMGIVEGE